MERNENNKVLLIGSIEQEPEYDHSIYDEGIYKLLLKVERKSENFDMIPILVSERLMNLSLLKQGTKIKITGKFNSFNKHEGFKSKLILYVFAKDIEIVDVDTFDVNSIYLKGYLCKEPIYRKTPLGREITDILVAIDRNYNKSDYIPCIIWGRNAKYIHNNYTVGNIVSVEGRIQSRQYNKQQSDGTCITNTAYEISVSRLISENNDDIAS